MVCTTLSVLRSFSFCGPRFGEQLFLKISYLRNFPGSCMACQQQNETSKQVCFLVFTFVLKAPEKKLFPIPLQTRRTWQLNNWTGYLAHHVSDVPLFNWFCQDLFNFSSAVASMLSLLIMPLQRGFIRIFPCHTLFSPICSQLTLYTMVVCRICQTELPAVGNLWAPCPCQRYCKEGETVPVFSPKASVTKTAA